MSYSILLVSAFAVAALGAWARRRSNIAGQTLVISGLLGAAACLVLQLRATLFPPDAAGPDRGDAVVGYYLANQVLAEVASQDGSVLLLFPPASVIDEDAVGTYSGTFSRVLRGFTGLKVEAVTLAVPGKAAKAGQIGLKVFQEAIAKAPAAVAYVSFAGVPADIEKLATGGSAPAGFYVFDPWGTTHWLAGLKAGRVRSVIVPRPGMPRGRKSEISGEPQEVFQQLYLMATPKTADEVARQLQTGAGR